MLVAYEVDEDGLDVVSIGSEVDPGVSSSLSGELQAIFVSFNSVGNGTVVLTAPGWYVIVDSETDDSGAYPEALDPVTNRVAFSCILLA